MFFPEGEVCAHVYGRPVDMRKTLKSRGVLREGVAVQYAWIEEHRERFPVGRMCDSFAS